MQANMHTQTHTGQQILLPWDTKQTYSERVEGEQVKVWLDGTVMILKLEEQKHKWWDLTVSIYWINTNVTNHTYYTNYDQVYDSSAQSMRTNWTNCKNHVTPNSALFVLLNLTEPRHKNEDEITTCRWGFTNNTNGKQCFSALCSSIRFILTMITE